MLFATALTNDSMTENFADPARFPVFDRLGREVMPVAAARGSGRWASTGSIHRPSRPAPAWTSRAPASRRSPSSTAKTAKTHSGIWRDLAVRKRKTEVDPQIGIIATLGAEAGVDTPAIDTLVGLIHDIEDGRRPQSIDTMRSPDRHMHIRLADAWHS